MSYNSCKIFVVLLVIFAVFLCANLMLFIDLQPEALLHEALSYGPDPPNQPGYWHSFVLKKELPSYVLTGVVWLCVMGSILWCIAKLTKKLRQRKQNLQ
jgi:hypothetical protein